MVYSEELRNNVISRVQNGESVNNISNELNISVATIYNWLKKCNEISTKEELTLKNLINEIKKLTVENKLEMALDLCNTSKGLHSIRIQSQKVKILLLMFEKSNNKELLKEALSICEKNKGNEIFEQQKTKIEKFLSIYFNKEIDIDSFILSNKIKSLTQEQNYTEALELCNNLTVSETKTIQSQKVKILLLMYKETNNIELLKEALNICEKYSDFESIQSQKIEIIISLFMENNNEELLNQTLKICNKYKTNEFIQSQKIKILLLMFKKSNNKELLEEAFNICEKYKQNKIIQNQKKHIKFLLKNFNKKIDADILTPSNKIESLMQKHKMAEALNLCNDKTISESEVIVSQKIKILLLMFKENNNKEILKQALNICEKYQNYEFIESQRIKILLLMHQDSNNKELLEEALKVCEKHPDYKVIQSQKIRILLLIYKENNNMELLKETQSICEKYQDDETIESQKIEILLLMFKRINKKELLEEALTICDKYKGNAEFEIKRSKINRQVEEFIATKYSKVLTIFLTRIYQNDISLEELKNSEIELWQKHLLLISYYEKNDKKTGVSYIKKIKSQYQTIPEKKKILNLLYERLVSKKQKLFDPTIYSKYLNCTIDQTLINPITQIEKENTIKETSTKINLNKDANNQVKPKNKPTTKIISCTGVTLNRYNQPNNSNNKNNNNNNSTKNYTTKTLSQSIKDLFPKEVFEIGAYLYVQMNKADNKSNAIKAWDIFDNLINKSSDDKEALTRMISLLRRLENSDILTIKPNESNLQKRLKK